MTTTAHTGTSKMEDLEFQRHLNMIFVTIHPHTMSEDIEKHGMPQANIHQYRDKREHADHGK